MAPFNGWGSTLSRLQSHNKEPVFTINTVPKNSWYSSDRPLKHERLSQTWSHPVVLNMGLLGPLGHFYFKQLKKKLLRKSCKNDYNFNAVKTDPVKSTISVHYQLKSQAFSQQLVIFQMLSKLASFHDPQCKQQIN